MWILLSLPFINVLYRLRSVFQSQYVNTLITSCYQRLYRLTWMFSVIICEYSYHFLLSNVCIDLHECLSYNMWILLSLPVINICIDLHACFSHNMWILLSLPVINVCIDLHEWFSYNMWILLSLPVINVCIDLHECFSRNMWILLSLPVINVCIDLDECFRSQYVNTLITSCYQTFV